MPKPFFVLASLLALSTLTVDPVHSAVYVWKDANGVTNFTDDPTSIPSGVTVAIRSYAVPAPTTPTEQTPSRSIVTQSEFALRLASELGFGEDLTPEQAAAVLTGARIAPRLGSWDLDEPVTPELLSRLRQLTLASVRAGRISITEEEALFAFDTASALAGMSTPQVSVREAPALPEPVHDQAPPPVYVYPPPPVVYERVIYVGGDVIPVHAPLIHVHKHVVHSHKHRIHKRRAHRHKHHRHHINNKRHHLPAPFHAKKRFTGGKQKLHHGHPGPKRHPRKPSGHKPRRAHRMTVVSAPHHPLPARGPSHRMRIVKTPSAPSHMSHRGTRRVHARAHRRMGRGSRVLSTTPGGRRMGYRARGVSRALR